MKKNRGITVKGKRIANLFNFLYDKCDEEPHFTQFDQSSNDHEEEVS